MRTISSVPLIICMDLGEWAADWYVQKVIEQAQRNNPYFITETMEK